jgi:hypothetical protein
VDSLAPSACDSLIPNLPTPSVYSPLKANSSLAPLHVPQTTKRCLSCLSCFPVSSSFPPGLIHEQPCSCLTGTEAESAAWQRTGSSFSLEEPGPKMARQEELAKSQNRGQWNSCRQKAFWRRVSHCNSEGQASGHRRKTLGVTG